MPKIYVVYGNLNRENDPDYKIHGAFIKFIDAYSYASDISYKSCEDLDIVVYPECFETSTPADVVSVCNNVVYGFSTNNWEVEIYIAEIELK